MKNSKLKYLVLGLIILSAQNSLSANYSAGGGSDAVSDESVAVGIGYTDTGGVTHKNIAGNASKPSEKSYATAIGIANKASGEGSSAFGLLNKANEKESSAFGFRNIASGGASSAFGYWNVAAGEASSAFGYWNTAAGKGSSAFGYQTFVSGEGSGAFGRGNRNGGDYEYKIEGKDSWAIGSYNKIATGSDRNHILGNNVSIGAGITDTVVLGSNSAVTESKVVSVGSDSLKRKIVNVAAGENDTDAVNKKQLDDAIASVSGGGGGTPGYTKAQSDAKFLDKSAYNADKANLATKAELNNKADKDGSNLSASDVAALKAKLSVATVSSIANTAAGTGSTGLGHGNVVTGNSSTAVGYKNEVSGNNSGAFGDPNIVSGHRSYAFGNDNKIAGNDIL